MNTGFIVYAIAFISISPITIELSRFSFAFVDAKLAIFIILFVMPIDAETGILLGNSYNSIALINFSASSLHSSIQYGVNTANSSPAYLHK